MQRRFIRRERRLNTFGHMDRSRRKGEFDTDVFSQSDDRQHDPVLSFHLLGIVGHAQMAQKFYVDRRGAEALEPDIDIIGIDFRLVEQQVTETPDKGIELLSRRIVGRADQHRQFAPTPLAPVRDDPCLTIARSVRSAACRPAREAV